MIACGGPQYNDSYVVNNNCITFAGGAWVTSHNLAVERGAHLVSAVNGTFGGRFGYLKAIPSMINFAADNRPLHFDTLCLKI